jgi:hypothetical protein
VRNKACKTERDDVKQDDGASDAPEPAREEQPQEPPKAEIKEELPLEARPTTWEFPEHEEDEDDDMSLMISVEETLDKPGEENALNTTEGSLLTFIIDTGATGCLMSVEAAEALSERYPGALKQINPEHRRRYRVASGATVITSSRAEFAGLPILGSLTADILEKEEGSATAVSPTLLGIDWLKSNSAVLDLGSSTLTVGGKKLPTVRQHNGHMVINLSGL